MINPARFDENVYANEYLKYRPAWIPKQVWDQAALEAIQGLSQHSFSGLGAVGAGPYIPDIDRGSIAYMQQLGSMTDEEVEDDIAGYLFAMDIGYFEPDILDGNLGSWQDWERRLDKWFDTPRGQTAAIQLASIAGVHEEVWQGQIYKDRAVASGWPMDYVPSRPVGTEGFGQIPTFRHEVIARGRTPAHTAVFQPEIYKDRSVASGWSNEYVRPRPVATEGLGADDDEFDGDSIIGDFNEDIPDEFNLEVVPSASTFSVVSDVRPVFGLDYLGAAKKKKKKKKKKGVWGKIKKGAKKAGKSVKKGAKKVAKGAYKAAKAVAKKLAAVFGKAAKAIAGVVKAVQNQFTKAKAAKAKADKAMKEAILRATVARKKLQAKAKKSKATLKALDYLGAAKKKKKASKANKAKRAKIIAMYNSVNKKLKTVESGIKKISGKHKTATKKFGNVASMVKKLNGMLKKFSKIFALGKKKTKGTKGLLGSDGLGAMSKATRAALGASGALAFITFLAVAPPPINPASGVFAALSTNIIIACAALIALFIYVATGAVSASKGAKSVENGVDGLPILPPDEGEGDEGEVPEPEGDEGEVPEPEGDEVSEEEPTEEEVSEEPSGEEVSEEEPAEEEAEEEASEEEPAEEEEYSEEGSEEEEY